MKKLVLLVVCALFATVGFSQSIVGKWKTIDDETGKPKSIVEIYKAQNGKYYGKVVKLFREPGEELDPICDECPEDDYRYNQRVITMKIVSGLKENGNVYDGGTILDPAKGKIYTCKMWKEGDSLKVRGYIGFLYRTQTWLPAN